MSDIPWQEHVEFWFQDEMRVGQKNGCTRQWADKGTRPRQPADQRYESAYVFGAVCPERDTGVALVLPEANTHGMQAHIDAISEKVAKDAIAILLLDNAAWHRTNKLKWPENLRPLFIPPFCPELNAEENIWQFLRQNYLSNRVFPTYTDVVDAACAAWNKLCQEAGRITSIATRHWLPVCQW
jgi:DDE superfamily endonuclease